MDLTLYLEDQGGERRGDQQDVEHEERALRGGSQPESRGGGQHPECGGVPLDALAARVPDQTLPFGEVLAVGEEDAGVVDADVGAIHLPERPKGVKHVLFFPADR